MNEFNIPVVLFLFRRYDTISQIIGQLRKARVCKLYLLSDQGRNEEERKQVEKVRNTVEKAIDWECDVIKNYANQNRGVFGNIALGARWVFEREDCAIFLEDDNLPEVTFFQFCAEMLERYRDDNRVLWVCGTNYLGQYKPDNNASYMFTKHMLPCGWASWSNKFLKYYDAYAEILNNPMTEQRFISDFPTKAMSNVYIRPLRKYREGVLLGKQPDSWDYQMCLSIRANSMYGISPVCNQIKNIGVDALSEHGGTSMKNVMTKRFCGMESYSLQFPLRHPIGLMTDLKYERLIDQIITPPFRLRLRYNIGKLIKGCFGRKPDERLFGKGKK